MSGVYPGTAKGRLSSVLRQAIGIITSKNFEAVVDSELGPWTLPKWILGDWEILASVCACWVNTWTYVPMLSQCKRLTSLA